MITLAAIWTFKIDFYSYVIILIIVIYNWIFENTIIIRAFLGILHHSMYLFWGFILKNWKEFLFLIVFPKSSFLCRLFSMDRWKFLLHFSSQVNNLHYTMNDWAIKTFLSHETLLATTLPHRHSDWDMCKFLPHQAQSLQDQSSLHSSSHLYTISSLYSPDNYRDTRHTT